MRKSRIIIVGFGPAGMACAIQMKRMGLQPLVIEKDRPGGLLINANLVENYPGFPEGIPGADLVRLFTKHADQFDIGVIKDNIHHINFSDEIFHLEGMNDSYDCQTLVVATGTVPVIPADCPMNLVAEGLIHFDISLLRAVEGKTIGIIGAGDAAFDYSLTLLEKENKVFLFNRGNKVSALKVLQEKIFFNNDINYLENISLKSVEMHEGKRLTAIFIRASLITKYVMDYLIFAIGRKPANDLFPESLRDEIPGLLNDHRLYLIGDIINGSYRQVSVAVGDGVKIAMEIFRHESNQ
jgi:thioredoxin reductase